MTNLVAPLTHANEAEHRRRIAQTANAAYSLAQRAVDEVEPVRYWLDSFTASANQSSFTLSNVPPSLGSIDATVNGITLVNGADFTLNGSTVTVLSPLSAGDEVTFRYSNKVGNYNVFTTFQGQDEFAVNFDVFSLASLDVSCDGLTMVNGVDFTVSGNVVSFSTPFNSGKHVLIRQTGEPNGQPAYRLVVQTATALQSSMTLSREPAGLGAVDLSIDGLSLPASFSGNVVSFSELDGGEEILIRYAVRDIFEALPSIPDATVGTEVDRINDILSVLRVHGLIQP